VINTANSLCELHSNIKIIIFQQAYIVYILAVKHKMHTAVSSGSWCGGQRQQCGDSGSGLR